MLLTITTTCRPATDLGFLLHKHPGRCQEFDLGWGRAYVFYSEATEERCTAALLLDVDPVGMVRGRPGALMGGPLDQYVNDRPYVASSFLSVAIARVYGTALQGRCAERPELAGRPLPLRVRIAVLPCRDGQAFLRGLFEPLGYRVEAAGYPLDEKFPEWGESPYYTVELERTAPLSEVLTHLYVLVPVLDNSKHYYVGDAEVEKLLARGERWLAGHPMRQAITQRYLKHRPGLAREALARLAEETPPAAEEAGRPQVGEDALEAPLRLNDLRLAAVLSALKDSGAKRVLDLGCGEGRLLGSLLREKQFQEIVGVDVSVHSLEIARAKLRLDDLPEGQRARIRLLHGSLMYRDRRFSGFDAAAVVEVVEHLDPPRLRAFERVLFEFARPRAIVLTTPNREYNATWEDLAAGGVRHRDHRFEWTRAEFQAWAGAVAERYGYGARFLPVGPVGARFGPPTQMVVFELRDGGAA